MARSFTHCIALLLIAVSSWSVSALSKQAWKPGDLIQLDCPDAGSAVPHYLSVQEVASNRDARLAPVEDRSLHDLVIALETESGHRIVDQLQGAFDLHCEGSRCAATQAQAPSDGPSEDFGCTARRLSPCSWLSRVRAEHAQTRVEILKGAGDDNWKVAFDAEQIEKSAAFLQDKYGCPAITPSARIE